MSIDFRYYGLQLWFPEYFKRLESGCNGGNSTDECNLRYYQDTLYTALASLPGGIAGIILINFIGGRLQLSKLILKPM